MSLQGDVEGILASVVVYEPQSGSIMGFHIIVIPKRCNSIAHTKDPSCPLCRVTLSNCPTASTTIAARWPTHIQNIAVNLFVDELAGAESKIRQQQLVTFFSPPTN
jgi:hypothetical protein